MISSLVPDNERLMMVDFIRIKNYLSAVVVKLLSSEDTSWARTNKKIGVDFTFLISIKQNRTKNEYGINLTEPLGRAL